MPAMELVSMQVEQHSLSGASVLEGGEEVFLGCGEPEALNVQIYVPDFSVQKCLQIRTDETVWELKQRVLGMLPKEPTDGFNYGLFLPPCNGRAGKFLHEERPFKDYPFQDCVPYLELKYKKRVYKMLNLNEKKLKHLHTKSNMRKLLEYVGSNNVSKAEKLLSEGLDPNFHESHGETPLTLAASTSDSQTMMLTLVNGGAHLDFRNAEGQTPLHRAALGACQANVKTLLELGASPNCLDGLGLTPLYYSVLSPGADPSLAELLLRDYSQLGIKDAQGNNETHQACKNNLVQHLEHLLFYGADYNCQNSNGNTPLHVCAVNNSCACARVLLFRGADAGLCNNQGQTAYHLAVLTGHLDVASVIKEHEPTQAVPYRGLPKYNSKRRLTWSRKNTPFLARSRSMSLTEANSLPRRVLRSSAPSPSPSLQNFDATKTMPHNMRQAFAQQLRASAATGAIPTTTAHAHTPCIKAPVSGSATLTHRRSTAAAKTILANGHYASSSIVNLNGGAPPISQASMRVAANPLPQKFANISTSSDVNIPRVLVIPRGPKGFGFILRGAKRVEHHMQFEPTPEIPGLQYFEGIDMNGMAMRAGLKPGDFLLEINGLDVRCASHDEVVSLIQDSGDTISLKVVTVDLSQPIMPAPYYATLPRRCSAQQAAVLRPAPPRRNPSTSLSLCSSGPAVRRSSLSEAHFARQFSNDAIACRSLADLDAALDHYDEDGRSIREEASPSLENGHRRGSVDMADGDANGVRLREEKVASIRGRVRSRRTSMNEMEQLIARQAATEHNNQQAGMSPQCSSSKAKVPAKVYSSVSEMKRRRQKSLNSGGNYVEFSVPPVDYDQASNALYNAPPGMTSCTSSPDLKLYGRDQTRVRARSVDCGLPRRPSSGSVKSVSFEDDAFLHHSLLPAPSGPSSQNEANTPSEDNHYGTPERRSIMRESRSTVVHQTQQRSPRRLSLTRPKTPPPPPPPLAKAGAVPSAPPLPPDVPVAPPLPSGTGLRGAEPVASSKPGSSGQSSSSTKADCRGITAQALVNVKLKKAPPVKQNSSPGGLGRVLPEGPNCSRAHDSSQNSGNRSSNVSSGGSYLQQQQQQDDGTSFYIPEPDYSPPKAGDTAPSKGGGDFRTALAQRRLVMDAGSDHGSGSLQEGSSSSVDTSSRSSPKSLDFSSDLRNAIARQRSKLDRGGGKNAPVPTAASSAAALHPSASSPSMTSAANSTAPSAGRTGLSLKESVHSQVPPASNANQVFSSKQPVMTNGSASGGTSGHQATQQAQTTHGTAGKKDSGYTSSRNSLEPSECGDSESGSGSTGAPRSPDFPPPPPVELLQPAGTLPEQSRVSMISQQLEEKITFSPAAAHQRKVPPSLPPKQTAVGIVRKQIGGSKGSSEHDSVSLSSTLSTLSGCSDAFSDGSSNQCRRQPAVVSYAGPFVGGVGGGRQMRPSREDPDSGTGDSEGEDGEDVTPTLSQVDVRVSAAAACSNEYGASVISIACSGSDSGSNSSRCGTVRGGGNQFLGKALPQWTVEDVCDWLDSLYLSEYKRRFAHARVDGRELLAFERSHFTKLGVTRIAHRITIENSLKDYKPVNTTSF